MKHRSNFLGTLCRVGKWGRAEPRLALRQDVKQELGLLVDRGWEQKPSTKVTKGQGIRVVRNDEPGQELYFWRLLWLRTGSDGNKQRQWGKMPFGLEGSYAAPKAWEEPSLRSCGCSDKVAPSTMAWCSLNHPKGSSVKGFVIKLRVIHLVFKVTGNLR